MKGTATCGRVIHTKLCKNGMTQNSFLSDFAFFFYAIYVQCQLLFTLQVFTITEPISELQRYPDCFYTATAQMVPLMEGDNASTLRILMTGNCLQPQFIYWQCTTAPPTGPSQTCNRAPDKSSVSLRKDFLFLAAFSATVNFPFLMVKLLTPS